MPVIKEDPLSKYDPNSFSFGKVKGEVSMAMQQDWKRDKVDDAKKRAITDSRSYDEFKARVAGCTLKPIHRNEFNAPPKFSFNRQSADSATSGNAQQTSSQPLTSALPSSANVSESIKTGRDFERQLRRCSSSQEKASLVASLDSDTIARLFSRELDAEVLRQILEIFDEVANSGEFPARRFLTDVAVRCPTSAAFASAFLTPAEHGIVAKLLRAEQAVDPSDDVRICAAFGINPSSLEVLGKTMPSRPVAESLQKHQEGAAAEVGCNDMD